MAGRKRLKRGFLPQLHFWCSLVGFGLLMAFGAGCRDSAQQHQRKSQARPAVVQYPPPEITIPATLAELERQIKNEPKNFTARFYLMCLYAQRGRWEQCLEVSLEAMGIDGSDVNIHLGAIYALANLGQLDKALEQVELSLKRSFRGWEHSMLLRVKGDLLMDFYSHKKNRAFLKKAEVSYRQAVESDSDNALAWIGLARVEIERSRLHLAQQYLRRVLQRVTIEEPGGRRKRALALYYLGVIEDCQGQSQKATDFYQQAMRIHPQSFRQSTRG
jgi:tetratricopeptide (TPR) repeat protein